MFEIFKGKYQYKNLIYVNNLPCIVCCDTNGGYSVSVKRLCYVMQELTPCSNKFCDKSEMVGLAHILFFILSVKFYIIINVYVRLRFMFKMIGSSFTKYIIGIDTFYECIHMKIIIYCISLSSWFIEP